MTTMGSTEPFSFMEDTTVSGSSLFLNQTNSQTIPSSTLFTSPSSGPRDTGKAGFVWPWLLAPVACILIIFVGFEFFVIRRPCRRKYKKARPILPTTGGMRTYESYDTSSTITDIDRDDSSGMPSTTSLISPAAFRHPSDSAPCSACGNSRNVRMGVSSFRGKRLYRGRVPRAETKNPLYWYRVPIRENQEEDLRTIRTVSSCTSVMTDTTSGGRSTDMEEVSTAPSVITTPTVSLKVGNNSTEFRGNGYVIKMEAERDREAITTPLPTKPQRTPPSYDVHMSRELNLNLENTQKEKLGLRDVNNGEDSIIKHPLITSQVDNEQGSKVQEISKRNIESRVSPTKDAVWAHNHNTHKASMQTEHDKVSSGWTPDTTRNKPGHSDQQVHSPSSVDLFRLDGLQQELEIVSAKYVDVISISDQDSVNGHVLKRVSRQNGDTTTTSSHNDVRNGDKGQTCHHGEVQREHEPAAATDASSLDGEQGRNSPASSSEMNDRCNSDNDRKSKGPPPPYKPRRIPSIHLGGEVPNNVSITSLGWV